MVVLKRLEDAERDGDQILGVIAGVGLSNDGRGKFLLSPNPKGQQLAFKRAYTEDHVSPEQTSFIECHATGTPLGDVTEMNSIADFFQEHNKKPLLGSVKSNMGHLLTAAGMPGLLKVLLSIKNEIIPSSINLEVGLKTNSGWLGQEQMILEPTPWNSEFKQAGINSFGFGGTNAHMVIQNHQKNLPAIAKKNNLTISEMAIVGMDAHFGGCENLDEFYYSIFNNRQHFKELPRKRWKGFETNSDLLKDFGLNAVPKGAYVADFEIDLLRFKIQPNEAKTLEPQQALILKVADNAIKDAQLSESANVAV